MLQYCKLQRNDMLMRCIYRSIANRTMAQLAQYSQIYTYLCVYECVCMWVCTIVRALTSLSAEIHYWCFYSSTHPAAGGVVPLIRNLQLLVVDRCVVIVYYYCHHSNGFCRTIFVVVQRRVEASIYIHTCVGICEYKCELCFYCFRCYFCYFCCTISRTMT